MTGLLALFPMLVAAGPVVTIHKIDDTTVTGDLTAVANGKLTVRPSSTQPTEVALTDVLVVTTPATVIAAPAPTTIAEAAPVEGTTTMTANGNMVRVTTVRAAQPVGVVGGLIAAFGGGAARPAQAVPATPAAPATTAGAAAKPAGAVTTGHLLDGVFDLANGDHFHGGTISWDDKTAKLQVIDVTAPLDVPAGQMMTFWVNDPSAVAQAKAMAVDPGPEDLAYVKKDTGVSVVKGLVLGVAKDGVAFRFDGNDRKIDRAKIVGLVLRGNSAKPDAAFHQLFHTVHSDVISGKWTGLEGEAAVIETPFGTTMKLPMKSIVSVGNINGRVVYVSDLKPSNVEQVPFFGRLIPYRLDQSLDGGVMNLSDGPHTRGIAVHSRCVLTYDIAGGYERFKTDLGLDLPGGKLGRVAVRILGDDKVLFEKTDLRGDQPAVPVDVDVAGVKKLVLEVDFGADQDTADRVDWAEARLTRTAISLTRF